MYMLVCLSYIALIRWGFKSKFQEVKEEGGWVEEFRWGSKICELDNISSNQRSTQNTPGFTWLILHINLLMKQ